MASGVKGGSVGVGVGVGVCLSASAGVCVDFVCPAISYRIPNTEYREYRRMNTCQKTQIHRYTNTQKHYGE